MTEDNQLSEQKTERFNMFLSPSEMKQIDDWAWENRIRSKSEAVRRLIQLGAITKHELKQVLGDAVEMHRTLETVAGVSQLLETENVESPDWKAIALLMMKGMGELALQVAKVSISLDGWAEKHNSIVSPAETSEALNRITSIQELVAAKRELASAEDLEELEKLFANWRADK